MRRVRLLHRFAFRGGAAYNVGEVIALDDGLAHDLIHSGRAVDDEARTPPVVEAVLTPPEHRMVTAPPRAKGGRRAV